MARQELPPRTRRILEPSVSIAFSSGTTSAHAENTPRNHHERLHERNYLRARGEYAGDLQESLNPMELPPRTRRIHSHGDHFDEILGTTSAHAENTCCYPSEISCIWNYLRARGEYWG